MTKIVRPITIAVCGPSEATPNEWVAAEQTGRLLAEHGCIVACGGLGGVMQAVCKGAKNAGGTTIGIIPSYEKSSANPWVDHVICTGIGQARNAVLVATGDAVIAIAGGFGTLSEIGLALKIGRPVVFLPGGDLTLFDEAAVDRLRTLGGTIEVSNSPEGAVEQALALVKNRSISKYLNFGS
jgi:uncharacterized protein (TIGR00725 family)